MGIDGLTRAAPGSARTGPNSAVGLALAAVAVILIANARLSSIARAVAVLLALLGALTLIEHSLDLNLHIDQLAAHVNNAASPHPGRISPITATAFVLLGLAFLTIDSDERHLLSETSAILVCLIATFAVVGYAYGVGRLTAIGAHTRIPLQVAIGLLALGLTTIAARPSGHLMRIFAAPGLGGAMVRRLLPCALAVPFCLGYIRLEIAHDGLPSLAAGTAFIALAYMIVFAFLVLWSGDHLTRLDAERRRLLQAAAEAQRMESVGRLAGGVAHDFNNLLTIIAANVELALLAIPEDASARDDMEEIRATAERAAHVAQRLLTFARAPHANPEVVDLSTVVRDAVPLLKQRIGSDVAVVLHCAPESAPVWIERAQLEHVIQHLAANACDAMTGGGTIRLEAGIEAPRTGGLTETPRAYLSVADTGIGMSDEVRARIFEPFFTTKTPGQGTGLGLAACYGIIKGAGGEIEVESSPMRGSTFRVFLPLTDRVATQHTLEPDARTANAGVVLVVEDEDAIRNVASRALRQAGYDVLEAANGHTALTIASRVATLDLVVTDVVMPVIGGRELSDRLRETKPDIPVLFTSGYTAGALDGADFQPHRFLAKPYTASQLVTRVRQLLDRKGLEREQVRELSLSRRS
jgi:signal transduction histidine kinase/ActR/RegA family two-component response regulator